MNNFIQNISAISLKLQTIIFVAITVTIASCVKEADSEYRFKADRLNFKVTEYSAEHDLWQNGCHTKAAAYSKDVVILQGESAPDTLFLHSSVSNETGKDMTKETATKSEPAGVDNFYDSFGIFASTYFGTWDESILPDYMHNVAVTKSSGWTTDYMWPKASGSKIRFFAYAPYNGNGISFSDDKLHGRPVLNYTVPQKVEEQLDLLIAETSEIDCNSAGPVSLEFRHIMSAIRFVIGDDAVSSTIKSISIKGVFSSGSCKIQEFPAWYLGTTRSDFSLNVNKEVSGMAGESVTAPAQTFMMLPQTLPSGAAIEVVYNDGTDHLLRADISGRNWEMGKMHTYKITNSNVLWESVLEIGNGMEVPFSGGEVDFKIRSYKEDGNGRIEPVSWTAEFSTDGGQTWSYSAPDWLLSFPTNGNGSVDTACYENIEIAFNDEGKIAFDEILRNAEPVTDDYNLSNSNGEPLIENTANCYIVNAPGRYYVPLVYGNGIRDCFVNYDAYISPSAGSNVLRNFLNHRGEKIVSPVIHENEDCEAGGVALLWQDAKNLVTDVSLSQDRTALIFNIRKETIQQGNAVVAVLDKDGVIMWSWHIWVTPYIPNLEADKYNAIRDKIVTNRNNHKYTMMPFNIGWCSTDASIFQQRDVQVRITQNGTKNAKSAVLKYTQSGGLNIDSESLRTGNCTYYQWGRKDPMMPATGSYTKTWYNGNGYIKTEISTDNLGYDIESCIIGQITSPDIMNSADIRDGYYNLWSTINTKGNGNETKVVKTIYDPSPVGYCVPPPAAYSSFSFTGRPIYMLDNFNVEGEFDNGFNFYCNKMNADKTKDPNGGVITFPAVGYRSSYDGEIVYAGSAGLYWTAVPWNYLYESYILGFNSSYVDPAGECPNNYALPVRPVKEP